MPVPDARPCEELLLTRLPYPGVLAPIGPPRRDPTALRAVSRTSSAPTPAAPVPVLRSRLLAALGRDDGLGALLLAHHIRRAVE